MLELYQAEGCPYSERVRETMTDLGLSYVVHNPRRPGDAGGETLNDQVHAELTNLSGADQIPFLVDHGTGQMHAESEDIVAYLEAEYGERSPDPETGRARRSVEGDPEAGAADDRETGAEGE